MISPADKQSAWLSSSGIQCFSKVGVCHVPLLHQGHDRGEGYEFNMHLERHSEDFTEFTSICSTKLFVLKMSLLSDFTTLLYCKSKTIAERKMLRLASSLILLKHTILTTDYLTT